MIWKIFLTTLAIIMGLILLFIGRAFAKDVEDHVTGESHKDEDGRSIVYSMYGIALLIFVLTFLYLY